MLPCKKCGGRCCGPVPLRRRVFKEVRKRFGVPKGTKIVETAMGVLVLNLLTEKCGFYVGGKCAIYELRPGVCKLYGECEALPCAYLHPEEAAKLTMERVQRMRDEA